MAAWMGALFSGISTGVYTFDRFGMLVEIVRSKMLLCISSRSTNPRCVWTAKSFTYLTIRDQGYIATCSANALWLHTINARPIAKLDLTPSVPRTRSPCVTSIAFHERDYSPLGILAIGHADGTVVLYTWNAEDTPKGVRAQWGFLKVRDLEAEKNSSVSITSLDFIG